MKKVNVLCVSVLSLTLVFTSLSTNVLAYALMKDGYYQSTIPVNLSNVSSYNYNAMTYAITAWNDRDTACTVTENSSSNNYVYAVTHLPDTAWGLYSPDARNSDPNHCVTSFSIFLNANNFEYSTSNERRSTCAHELGHAMGLDDITSGTAIMNIYRNRSLIYRPKNDDANGVNASWQ